MTQPFIDRGYRAAKSHRRLRMVLILGWAVLMCDCSAVDPALRDAAEDAVRALHVQRNAGKYELIYRDLATSYYRSRFGYEVFSNLHASVNEFYGPCHLKSLRKLSAFKEPTRLLVGAVSRCGDDEILEEFIWTSSSAQTLGLQSYELTGGMRFAEFIHFVNKRLDTGKNSGTEPE